MGCTQGKLRTYPSEQTVDVAPWKLLYTTSIEEWQNSEAVRWDFSSTVDLSAKKTRLQPWTTRGRLMEALLPAPLDVQELDVKYMHDQVLVSDKRLWKNHRFQLHKSYKPHVTNRMKTSPFLESAQVIGARDHVGVLQIARNDGVCDFLFVDFASEKVVGSWQEEYLDQPYLCECEISPDHSRFLLKPNLLYVLKFRVHVVDDCIKVIGRSKDSPFMYVTAEMFKDSALDLMMTFDPRYGNTRVAIGNMTKRGQHVLCIYNLKSKKIMQKTYGPQYQRTQNLVFSPDGELLAALIVTYILGPNMYPQRFNFLGVMVYSTQNMTLLHKIQSFGTQAVPTLTPAAVFPLFSRLGELLAMGSGSGTAITRVEVYRMPSSSSLRHLCRFKINQHLTPVEIANLPVPEDCRKFLLYKPTQE